MVYKIIFALNIFLINTPLYADNGFCDELCKALREPLPLVQTKTDDKLRDDLENAAKKLLKEIRKREAKSDTTLEMDFNKSEVAKETEKKMTNSEVSSAIGDLTELDQRLSLLAKSKGLSVREAVKDSIQEKVLSTTRNPDFYVTEQFVFYVVYDDLGQLQNWKSRNGKDGYAISTPLINKINLLAELKPNGTWNLFTDDLKVQFVNWSNGSSLTNYFSDDLLYATNDRIIKKSTYRIISIAGLTKIFQSLRDVRDFSLFPKSIREMAQRLLKKHYETCVLAVNSREWNNSSFKNSYQVRANHYRNSCS